MARARRIDTQRQEQEKRPGFLTRLRRRRPGIDHVLRAYDSYTEHYGAHYAAAITYFSVLSLFPLLLLAFSALGFALHGDPSLRIQIRQSLATAMPAGPLRGLVSTLIQSAVAQRGGTGIVGLVIALYSGVGWMGNLRNALTAQWGGTKPQISFLPMLLKDLVALVGLGIAMIVSFGLTALASGSTRFIVHLLGFSENGPARYVLVVLGIVLSVAANWVIFIWVIARLPRSKVQARSAVRGALVMAIGFEVLKQVMTIYLRSLQSNPAYTVIGPILGLMVFANFVSQLLLFITAWIATARENQNVEVPEPGAVVRPVIGVSSGPSGAEAAGLVGFGALLTYLLIPRSRHRD